MIKEHIRPPITFEEEEKEKEEVDTKVISFF
jgi:hypothetical protein